MDIWQPSRRLGQSGVFTAIFEVYARVLFVRPSRSQPPIKIIIDIEINVLRTFRRTGKQRGPVIAGTGGKVCDAAEGARGAAWWVGMSLD